MIIFCRVFHSVVGYFIKYSIYSIYAQFIYSFIAVTVLQFIRTHIDNHNKELVNVWRRDP